MLWLVRNAWECLCELGLQQWVTQTKGRVNRAVSCINVGEALICKAWRLISEAALVVVRSGGLGVRMQQRFSNCEESRGRGGVSN